MGHSLRPVLQDLRHLSVQDSAAQNVKMQVGNGLAGITAAVGNHAVAVFQTLLLCNFWDHGENMGDQRRIFLCDLSNRGDVTFGNHQNVGRRLGRDMPEGEDLVILIYLGRRDLTGSDLAKQTIHNKHLL